MKTLRILLLLTLGGAASISESMFTRFASRFAGSAFKTKLSLLKPRRIVAASGLLFTSYNEIMGRSLKQDIPGLKQKMNIMVEDLVRYDDALAVYKNYNDATKRVATYKQRSYITRSARFLDKSVDKAIICFKGFKNSKGTPAQ